MQPLFVFLYSERILTRENLFNLFEEFAMANRNEKFKPIARILVGTGLRRDLCAQMLGVNKGTISDWAKQGNWPVSKSFHTRGLHIGVEGFVRCRFKSLTGYLFHLIHARTERHIRNQFVCHDEMVARTFQFAVSQRLFAEMFERDLATFVQPTFEKQITPSQFSFFVFYVRARLIKIGTCDACGITAPEQLQMRKTISSYFCKCHKLIRGKEYWDKFNGVMFDEIFPRLDAGEIAGATHIEEELQKILREIALEAVCLTEKST